MVGGHWFGGVVALNGLATQVGEVVPANLVLHPFGDHVKAKVSVEVVDGSDDDLAVRVAGEGGDDAAVDLDFVDR
jgi:hypothetical protein